MSLKLQVTRGLKWQSVNIVGRQLLGFLVFTTLARLLEPAAFGLVALVGVYVLFVGMFADQGVGAALIQRQDLDPKHLDSAFWFSVGCSVVLCLLTVALADPVSLLLGEPQLVPLLRWSSLGLVINALSSVQSALFIKVMDFRRVAIRMLVASLAGGAVGIGMALAGYGVWALIGQQLATSVGGTIFLWMVSTYRPSMNFSLKHLYDLLRVSSSVFASSLLWFFSSRIDQVIIGRFLGAPVLGLYVVAGKIPELARTVTHHPVAEVALPALSRLQGDHAQLRQAIYRGMELNALVSFAVFVGIAMIATDLVALLFGSKWVSAGTLCALLALYALVNVLQVFFHPALLASGGVGRYVILNLWHVTGVLVACVAGIRFGVTNLVLGLIANGLIVAIPALIFLRHRIALSPLKYCHPCLVPAFASLFMAGLIWAAADTLSGLPLALRLVCKVIVGASAYIGFIWIFKRASLVSLFDVVRHALVSRSGPEPSVPPLAVR